MEEHTPAISVDRRSSGVHERILRILGAFSIDKPSLTLSDLARATDLPISTVHRIAAHLVDWGALERNGRDYVIGLRLFEIAALAPRAYQLRDRIHPFLEELLMKTRENVLYSVLEGGAALMVEQLVGHRAIKLISGVGSRLPLHASAMGLVMLAFGPSTLLAEHLSQPLVRLTSETVSDPTALRKAVLEIRHNSVAVTLGTIDPASVSIAAPIFQHRDFIGAISIVSSRKTTDIPNFANAVLDASRGISTAVSRDGTSDDGFYRRQRRALPSYLR